MKKPFLICLVAMAICWPAFVLAAPVISEIMYDVEGTDTGREWMEVSNNSSTAINLSDWKLFEASTNHKLTFVRGSESVPAGGYAIVADDPQKFLADWPNFSGTLFDSTFSLSNTGETLILRSPDLVDVDTVSYTNNNGGAGDGKSLQRTNDDWSAALPTPGLASALSAPTPLADNNSGSTTVATLANNSVGSHRIEPSIYADAGDDRTVAAGSVGLFTALASGLKNEPLEAERYFWTFGDGSFAEGKKIFHAYASPGTYLAMLEITSGAYVASARVKVTVVPATLSILSVSGGPQGGITLKNESIYELDLSWWQLVSGSNKFVFPKNTIVLPKATVTFPVSITSLSDINQGVSLFYPNGELASRFSYEAGVSKSAVINPTPVVSVAKKSPPVTVPKMQIAEPVIETQGFEQAAAVGLVTKDLGQNRGDKFSWPWLWGVLGLAVLAVSGVWYVNRANSDSAGIDTGGVAPGEFDLIEE
ncbi:MAG: lamin tail domain-containing protein [Candidatus Paceibacterota bacterium]|jgi:hypothetical protein